MISTDFLIAISVIVLLSVVQSVFGMGLLIFGTPIFLILGYDFLTALTFLLPASFMISLVQVTMTRLDSPVISKKLYFLCLPSIGVGLWLKEISLISTWTYFLVGSALLASALIRARPSIEALIRKILLRYDSQFHILMGFVHGFTNLGGAMLTIYAAETAAKKEYIRYKIAHYYLAFSIIQLTILATFLGQLDTLKSNIFTAVISLAVYILIGNHIYLRTSSSAYHSALTIFIIAFALAVFWSGFRKI